MLQKPTPFWVKEASVAASFQLEWRTSTTRGYSMNWRSRRSRYSRFREVFLNDTGNWMSNAPSLPSLARASRPSRVRASSSSVGRIVAAEVGSMTEIGEWVKERRGLAVNRKPDLQVEILRTQRLT